MSFSTRFHFSPLKNVPQCLQDRDTVTIIVKLSHFSLELIVQNKFFKLFGKSASSIKRDGSRLQRCSPVAVRGGKRAPGPGVRTSTRSRAAASSGCGTSVGPRAPSCSTPSARCVVCNHDNAVTTTALKLYAAVSMAHTTPSE